MGSGNRQCWPAMLLTLLFLPVPLFAGPQALDQGTLDPAWFDGSKEFHRTGAVDYLWVRDGFSIDGHTFHFEPWPTPVFIGPQADKRDADDMVLARQINGEMPALMELQLGAMLEGRAKVSLEAGDILVSGRIVDCSRGNQMVKFLAPTVAGKGLARIEMKFVHKESGELLAGLHTRVTSGTALTNTWNKMVKCVRKLSKELESKAFQALYNEGKPVQD